MAAEILRMLGQYEERCSGLTGEAPSQSVQQRHSYQLGYTATRYSLQSTRLSNRPKCSARRGACWFATFIPTGAALGYTLSSARRISSIRKGLIKKSLPLGARSNWREPESSSASGCSVLSLMVLAFVQPGRNQSDQDQDSAGRSRLTLPRTRAGAAAILMV